MLDALRSLLSFSREEGRGRNIRSDERGQFGEMLFPIIAGLAGIFGISCMASMDWTFLLATLIVGVIGLAVAGTIFFDIPFRYVIIIAVLCLGVVVFLEIGALTAIGIIIVGGVLYKFSPAKYPAIFIGLIGLGCLLTIWGSQFAVETLGLMP